MSLAITTAIGLVYPGLYSPPPEAAWVGPPVVITTTVLPTLFPEVPYAATIAVDGGKSQFRFGVTSGVLPPGLSLSLDGHITGTAPMVATMTPTTLPPATVDVFYGQTMTVADLRYPFTVRVVDAVGQVDEQSYELALWENPTRFDLESGTLPGCLSFGASGLAGPPMKVGTFPVTVRATDSHGRTFTQTYTLVVTS